MRSPLRLSDCFRLERPVAGWDLYPLEVATLTRRTLLAHYGITGLVAQRIYGLALGYEDLNDHDELRRDPRFFHGYYGHYCFPPLYLFCEEHQLLARCASSS